MPDASVITFLQDDYLLPTFPPPKGKKDSRALNKQMFDPTFPSTPGDTSVTFLIQLATISTFSCLT